MTKTSNDKKIEDIQYLCQQIMNKWLIASQNIDIYEEGKVVGRSMLAQTILEIIESR